MKKFNPQVLAADEAQPQSGALCYREGSSGIEILLITSRDTGRWIIPKGWPMAKRSDAEVAAREAYEEAGVEGDLHADPVGLFAYRKVITPEFDVPCVVTVFALRVRKVRDRFPERKERERAWLSPAEAAERVQEPELADMIRIFDPARHALS